MKKPLTKPLQGLEGRAHPARGDTPRSRPSGDKIRRYRSPREMVLVAMSGGVDSSVAALLLAERGYEVIGMTIKMHRSPSGVEDARRVCEALGIQHLIIDLQERFTEAVVDYFVKEYMSGRTPNPCVVCNRDIKFRSLVEKSTSLGARYVATGHYARLAYADVIGRYLLRRGRDPAKDQSYFLYTLTQDVLERLLLPLGDLKKEEVREIAAGHRLPVAEKRESQEICFVPDDDYRAFLRRTAGQDIRPGLFVDGSGKVLGEHRGYPFYTIGQRHGLGVSHGKRLYVVDIIPEENLVVLGDESDLRSSGLVVEGLNWIMFPELTSEKEFLAQIRYRSRPALACIRPIGNGRATVVFRSPQKAIAPGQAIVFYEGEYVAGGGTIASRLPKTAENHSCGG